MIGIYKITNLISGKAYVGQSVHIERRWQEHCRAGKRSLIGQAIEKYGKENFSFQVLEECDIDLLDEKEEYYIEKCNSIVPNGYNIMDWVEGHPTYYFNTDQDTILNIVYDIQNSALTLSEIAEKYDLSKRTITRINLGETHRLKGYEYPLRKVRVAEQRFCIDCGAPISSKAIRCVSCSHIAQQKTERPSRNELKELIRTMPFTQIGKFYGVSDNAVRKWCKRYGLPSKTSEIKQMNDSQWLEI